MASSAQTEVASNIVQTTIVFEKNWSALHELVPGKFESDGKPKRRYKYLLNRGSSRSSKTHSIIQLFWLFAWENPGVRLAVFRATKKQTRDTVFKDMKKIYPNMPGYRQVTLNKTELIWEFPNGSVIEINGTDEPEKIMGYNSDIIWLNEPYRMSKDTFDELDQRAEIALIIDINPKGDHWSNDLIKDDQCKFIHSTFRDNPKCPPAQKRKILSYQPVECSDAVIKELVGELEAYEYDLVQNQKNLTRKQVVELSRCIENQRKKSASKYKWLVYGMGEKADRPNRIFNWEEIPDEDYHKLDLVKHYGSDWGAVDPWAVVEAKYMDGCLYIHEINYLSENQIREKMTVDERAAIHDSEEGMVPYMFNKWEIPYNRKIVCDSNRPTKIMSLKKHGWDEVIPTLKYDGSIVEGIDTLLDLKVYYTSSSSNIMMEQESYSRKVDRLGSVLEEPEDLDNHCFVGSTRIITSRGLVPISEVNEGDMVLTSFGYRKVLKKFNNGRRKVFIYRMDLDSCSVSVQSTPDHKIKTTSGWIEIASLKQQHTIYHASDSGIQEQQIVRIVSDQESIEETYDLMVEEHHEYFAENILVHNCIDAIRYIAMRLKLEDIIRT